MEREMVLLLVMLGVIFVGVLLGLILNWGLGRSYRLLAAVAAQGSRLRGEALDLMKLDRNGEVQLPESTIFRFLTLTCDWQRLHISEKTCWEDPSRKMCESCLIKEWAEEKLVEHHRRTGR